MRRRHVTVMAVLTLCLTLCLPGCRTYPNNNGILHVEPSPTITAGSEDAAKDNENSGLVFPEIDICDVKVSRCSTSIGSTEQSGLRFEVSYKTAKAKAEDVNPRVSVDIQFSEELASLLGTDGTGSTFIENFSGEVTALPAVEVYAPDLDDAILQDALSPVCLTINCYDNGKVIASRNMECELE